MEFLIAASLSDGHCGPVNAMLEMYRSGDPYLSFAKRVGAVPQTAPFDYNGTFTTDDTAPAGGAPPPKTLSVAPAPLDNGAKIGFENFAAPGVLIRVKTTEDLQAAYSNGKHKQVMALLKKYGNGAKSFRELQLEDFVPIRKAIDDGALA